MASHAAFGWAHCSRGEGACLGASRAWSAANRAISAASRQLHRLIGRIKCCIISCSMSLLFLVTRVFCVLDCRIYEFDVMLYEFDANM